MDLPREFKFYYLTAVASLIFAVVGFSYNAWRLEATENNSNIRMASFELLKNLSQLEQIIYAAHYDNNTTEGSPRKGWVRIGLIIDLSLLIDKPTEQSAALLKANWQNNWNQYADDQAATERLVEDIDLVREGVKNALHNLK